MANKTYINLCVHLLYLILPDNMKVFYYLYHLTWLAVKESPWLLVAPDVPTMHLYIEYFYYL